MDIQLPGFVVAELYKDNLVIVPETKDNIIAVENPAKDKKINPIKTGVSFQDKKFWLGDNKKLVAVIAEDHSNVFLADNALQFLTNVLAACKLNLGDVAIVNIANTHLSFEEITSRLDSRYVLLFGVDAGKISLGENTELFVNTTINNIHTIAAPPLEAMILQTPDAKTLKARLWNGLKKMFGL